MSAMQINLWGVRGSLPSSQTPESQILNIEGLLRNYFTAGYRDANHISQFLKSLDVPVVGGYGTATTCVEVRTQKGQLIIDGGSGIRNLNDRIMSGYGGRVKGPYHIYMTHYHWDHVIGLPFFAPHFIPGINIHYYGVQKDLEKLIRGIFHKPYFPVPFEDLSSKVHFHILEPRKEFQLDDMTLIPYRLDHPDECWGLKIMSGGKTYSHCVDTEATRVTRDELGPDLALYQNVDFMYFDAQYTLPELAEKANWGHSAAQVGIDLAFREGIKKIYFGHHDPGATTHQILELKRQTAEYYNWRIENNHQPLQPFDWDYAHEGMSVVP